jgi:mannose-6-phosphate isomerase-like protein (cupin superfamily)
MDEPLMDSVSLGGIDVIFKLSAEQTGGVMSAVEVLVAPHRLALPHLHEREDELCLVTNGQVGWRVGDRELLAEPQSLTFLPRGVPHAYWNPSSSLARLVLVSVPGG